MTSIKEYIIKLISKFQQGPEVYIFHDILENKTDVKTEFALSQVSFEVFLKNRLKKRIKKYFQTFQV
jgi:hypothetical protein